MQDYHHKNRLFYFFQWFDMMLTSCVVDKYFTTLQLIIPDSAGNSSVSSGFSLSRTFQVIFKEINYFAHFGAERCMGCYQVALSVNRLFLLGKNKFIIRWGCG